jgi:hypothetical protein
MFQVRKVFESAAGLLVRLQVFETDDGNIHTIDLAQDAIVKTFCEGHT